jgi:hypothetical protein
MISLVLWRFSHGRMQLIASLRCSYVLPTGVRVGHNTKTVFLGCYSDRALRGDETVRSPRKEIAFESNNRAADDRLSLSEEG